MKVRRIGKLTLACSYLGFYFEVSFEMCTNLRVNSCDAASNGTRSSAQSETKLMFALSSFSCVTAAKKNPRILLSVALGSLRVHLMLGTSTGRFSALLFRFLAG